MFQLIKVNHLSYFVKNISRKIFFNMSKYQYQSKRNNQNNDDDGQQRLYNQNRIQDFKLPTIQKSYFEKIYPKIQQGAKQVIQLLMTPGSSKKQLARAVHSYLQFRNLTFQKNIRSDLGCMAVLVAMRNAKCIIPYEQYETRIVDFITLTDCELSAYDSVMMSNYLQSLYLRTTTNIQKNIRQYYRLKYVQMAINNFQNIDKNDYIHILNHISLSMKKDHYNFITKWRFYPLFIILNNKIIKLMDQYNKTDNQEKKKQLGKVILPIMIIKYIEMLQMFRYMTKQDALVFYEYIKMKQQIKLQRLGYLNILTKAISNVPFVYINQEKQTLSQKLLEILKDTFERSGSFRSYISTYNHKPNLVRKSLGQAFYRTYINLNFQTDSQNKFKILKKNSISIKPTINQFIWKLFKLYQRQILETFIINDVIYSIYPQRISPVNLQKRVQTSKSVQNMGSSDNQFNYRFWQGLKNLGYQYKSQTVVCQRSIDILIDDHIIIELDGQGHFSYENKQITQITAFRNYHLLLNGYKLINFNIFQYNQHRSVQQLQKLIQQKMNLIRQPDIVFVA